jgi:hypothetical protein
MAAASFELEEDYSAATIFIRDPDDAEDYWQKMT